MTHLTATLHRLAAFLDDDDAPVRASKLAAFERVLAAVLAAEALCNVMGRAPTPLGWIGSTLLVLGAAVAVTRRRPALPAGGPS